MPSARAGESCTTTSMRATRRADQTRRRSRLRLRPRRTRWRKTSSACAAPRELALAFVGQVADARQERRGARSARRVAQVEEQAIAFHDPLELGRLVEALRRRAMPVRAPASADRRARHGRRDARARSTRRPPSRTDRRRGSRAGIARNSDSAEQCGAAARADVRAHVVACDRRVKEMQAAAVHVPVGEPGLLAASVGAALHDLRADGEHVRPT